MFDRTLQLFVSQWKSEDSVAALSNGHFDLIVPISYTTCQTKLTRATEAIALRVIEIKKRYPRAAIVTSNVEFAFPGAEEVEWKLKKELFANHNTEVQRAGNINNSVQEAQAIAKYVAKNNLPSERILIVTGEMHSLSARWIWQRVIPDSEITITCINSKLEYQPDFPVLVQRVGPWKWFFANVARQILLRTLGLNFTSRFHHRSTG